jgi:uncharacterized protein (DUF362 family)
MNQQVFVWQSSTHKYPARSPFHPAKNYPEYSFDEIDGQTNSVYAAVRDCLRMAGLDSASYGTAKWNPFKDLIQPGETILLKPNLVKEFHPRDPDGWKYVLTHGCVIRAVADYVWKALDGEGKVIVADAPQTDSSFSEIIKVLGLDIIRDFYLAKDLNFELVDLRQEEWINKDGVIVKRMKLAGDPHGNIAFDLKDSSEFVDHDGGERYYGADYDVREVNYHHGEGRHEYLIAGTAIKADVVFSLPKLKTHKKAGVTVSLKNLVGINGDKNWLPHHTEGDPSTGGDEHPNPDAMHKLERGIVPYFRKLALFIPGIGPWFYRQVRKIGLRIFGSTENVIRSGNWWGNDTVWRMCLDLNKILFYGNPHGTFREPRLENRKRHYVFVDGIIAGEGSGPMNPDPVPAGLLLFGLHPPSVDAVSAYLMGFDPDRIPIVRQAFRCEKYPLAEWSWKDIEVISNNPVWNGLLPEIPHQSTCHFEPHFGWKGHIEREEKAIDG